MGGDRVEIVGRVPDIARVAGWSRLGRHAGQLLVAVAVAAGMAGIAQARQNPRRQAPLAITTEPMPPAYPKQAYQIQLQATGGVQPLRWSIFAGSLPPGLSLDEKGLLIGVPTQVGVFHFTAEVKDSSDPPDRRDREFTIKVVAPLLLEWSKYPEVSGDAIAGSVKISNGTEDVFDQTVIILAVNEYGKAFTLGYQHFDFEAGREKVEIPFGMSLPRGSYVIHACLLYTSPSPRD